MTIDGGLGKLFRRHLPLVDWQRIESPLTGPGIPDLNGCWRGVEVWVELKRTSGWKVSFRPEQIGWIERRLRAGGRVFLAVRQQARGERCERLWVLVGSCARALIQAGGLRNVPRHSVIGMWEGEPGSWDWEFVAKSLFSKRNL